MGTHFQRGFTIIETMLVLAVTGVLIATLLVGVGASINTQRYKDSVSAFKDTLQQEYAMVDNVTNDRQTNGSCGATVLPVEDGSGVAPGQSDCILMGRYISIENDTISAASVLGYQKSTTVTTDDISDLTTNYNLGIALDSINTSTLEWGAQIAWPKSGVDSAPSNATLTPPSRAISILIIRSPSSGTTYTFTGNTVLGNDPVNDVKTISSVDLLHMISVNQTTPPNQAQRFVCIDPSPGSTGLTVPEKLAVVIGQAASGASSIETRSDSVTASLGGNTVCQ